MLQRVFLFIIHIGWGEFSFHRAPTYFLDILWSYITFKFVRSGLHFYTIECSIKIFDFYGLFTISCYFNWIKISKKLHRKYIFQICKNNCYSHSQLAKWIHSPELKRKRISMEVFFFNEKYSKYLFVPIFSSRMVNRHQTEKWRSVIKELVVSLKQRAREW